MANETTEEYTKIVDNLIRVLKDTRKILIEMLCYKPLRGNYLMHNSEIHSSVRAMEEASYNLFRALNEINIENSKPYIKEIQNERNPS